ncbi:MAG: alanine racemase [Methyloglobulus sp.]|nr:alanine racemase [Methyloglobulus sp.]
MNPVAYAEINLAAVRHNLAKVRSHAPQAKIMAVVKANAYGHGLLRIAQALGDADAFAVARLDEGLRLRQAGIKHRIVVLQGFTDANELRQLIDYQMETIVHSSHQVDLLEGGEADYILPVWLKIDTGMNRLGFKAKDVDSMYRRLKQCRLVNPAINFVTHLASADDTSNVFTAQQIQSFNETLAPYPCTNQGERSIGNSAGILAWQDAISDWVRPGIMLYGISPFSDSTGLDLGLKPVMSLHSRLIAVKPVQKGESVGYGNSWVCHKDTTIGIIAIGYGDGYPRYAKPGTPIVLNGQRVPLVGRVSMDMITVDLAAQVSAKPGDKVTLWGDGLAVEEIARYADTIPYTLVCGITRRVHFRSI